MVAAKAHQGGSGVLTPERKAQEAKAGDTAVETAAPQLPPIEYHDGDFPPHMLVWTLVGTVGYFGIIAVAMIYAALLSR